jgi:hypothetical protein
MFVLPRGEYWCELELDQHVQLKGDEIPMKIHSVENPLDLSQLLPQPTHDEFSVSNLLQKVVFISVLHPKDIFV